MDEVDKKIDIGILPSRGQIQLQFSETPSPNEFKAGVVKVMNFLTAKFFQDEARFKGFGINYQRHLSKQFILQFHTTKDRGLQTNIGFDNGETPPTETKQ